MYNITNKKICIIICSVFVTQISVAQLFGPPRMINDEAGIIYGIHSLDIDNDGFNDIIVVASATVWYKNLDGQSNFNPPITIQEGLGQVFNSIIADIDGDGNSDLIISCFDEDKVVWFQNNGDGTFADMQTIATGLNRASGVTASDLDQDGDLDLVLGVSNGSGLYWVENINGQGDFSTLNVIDTNIIQARFQAVADIDGDGDMDILTNSVGDFVLAWYENTDGQGDFSTEHIIETDGMYEIILYLEDLDGDGHLDNLSYIGDTLIWRKKESNGNFGPKQIINTVSLGGITNSKPVDIDNDGDLDILMGSLENYRVGWHENLDGLGNFSPPLIIDSTLAGGSNIVATDLDNDGDLDLVVNSLVANGEKFLVWFENLTILNIYDLDIKYTILYPNPATTVLAIENTTHIEKVNFYNVLGQNLLTITKSFKQIDISSLSNGVLLVVIETELGKLTKKLVKK